MAEREVSWKFMIQDSATRALVGIASAGQRVSSAFNRASGLVANFGSIAAIAGGAFSVTSAISGTMAYLGQVKKVADVTGMAADHADGLVTAFKRVGLEGADVANIVGAMSKQGLKMDIAMAKTSGTMSGVAGLAQRLGIDVRRGPEAAFMRMASLAKDQKLSVEELSLAYHLPLENAQKLLKVLKGGPEQLQASIESLRRSGLAVTDDNLAAYSGIKRSQGAIKEMWERISIVVGSKLLPVIERLMKVAESKLSSWLPHVQKFGSVLEGFLTRHLGLVMKISKVMLLNASLMKLTGGQGLGNIAGRGLAAAGKFALGGVLPKEVMGTGLLNVLKALGPALGSFRGIVSVLGRLSAVGVAIGAAVYVVSQVVRVFQDNVGGVRDRVMSFFGRLQAHWAVISRLFSPVMDLFGESGPVGKFFAYLVPKVVDGLIAAVDGLLLTVETIVIVIKRVAENWKQALLHPVQLFSDSFAEAQRMVGEEQKRAAREAGAKGVADRMAGKGAPDQRAAAVYNFPNARFDITQKFDGNFDPDRIAVALTNGIAAQGERKLQSGFAPVFSIR